MFGGPLKQWHICYKHPMGGGVLEVGGVHCGCVFCDPCKRMYLISLFLKNLYCMYML